MERNIILLCLLLGLSWSTFADGSAWELITYSGSAPDPRAYHAAVSYGNAMWIYGGMNDMRGVQVFCDLQRYDFESYRWKAITNCTDENYRGPGKKYDMVYAVWRDCFLIHGGRYNSSINFADTWCFNFTSNHWTAIDTVLDKHVTREEDLWTDGLSGVIVDDNLLMPKNQKVYILNLTATPQQWTAIDPEGVNSFIPYNNYLLAYDEGSDRIWSFSGYGLNKAPMYWVNWLLPSNWTYVTPIILNGIPATILAKGAFNDAHNLVMWGGAIIDPNFSSQWDGTTYKFVNDSTSYLSWVKLPTTNDPAGRIGHTLIRNNANELFVFGGRTYYEKSGFLIVYNQLLKLSMATPLYPGLTTLECCDSVEVGQTCECLVHGYDKYGLVTGDSTMAKAFTINVTSAQNISVATTPLVYLDSVFRFSISTNVTGEISVSVKYLDDLIKNGPVLVNSKCPSMLWGSECSVHGWWIIGAIIGVVGLVVIIVVVVVVVQRRRRGYQPVN